MNAQRRCAACGQANGGAARFCRRCGAAIAVAPEALAASAESADAALNEAASDSVAEPAPFDDRRLLRELAWLCGLPLLLSVIYTIVVRVSYDSALADSLATAATALIALGGAAQSFGQVRPALGWPRARDWLATLVVALVTAPALMLAFWLIRKLGVPVYDDYLTPYVVDDWPLWVGFLNIAVFTPIFEELLFRGLLQPKLEQAISPTEAWIVQAALFAAAHLSPIALFTHFFIGLALGWVRRRSGSLLPGILLHAAWNGAVLYDSMTG